MGSTQVITIFLVLNKNFGRGTGPAIENVKSLRRTKSRFYHLIDQLLRIISTITQRKYLANQFFLTRQFGFTNIWLNVLNFF